MNSVNNDELLFQLNNFLAEKIGIYFSEERIIDLRRGISLVAKDCGYNDLETFIDWLTTSNLTIEKIKKIAEFLTIGETYFFRGIDNFEALEKTILPNFIKDKQGKKQLKIWSAGASTGEEAYSIAIILKRLNIDLNNWKISIIASDINPVFLHKAADGIYSEWSFRNTPIWVKQYFIKKDKNFYEILPSIKKMVTFFYHNLAEDNYPSLLNNINNVDIIFCRNVLMYFSNNVKRKVIKSLNLSLSKDGWLLVSPTETSQIYFSDFDTVTFPGAIFYQKKKSISISQTSQRIPILNKNKFENSLPVTNKHIFQFNKNHANSNNDLYKTLLSLYKQSKYSEITEKYAELFFSEKIKQNESTNLGEAMAILSRAFANQGQLDEARKWCQKAISINKLNPDFYYLMATILQEHGQIEEAIDELNKVLYIDYNFILAHFALGMLKQQQGKFIEADKHFENALTLLINNKEEVLLESEGLTAGRLAEIINSIRERNK